MSSKAKEHSCNCEYQIVWYFEKPTIVVCENCERTLHFEYTECPICKEEVSYFVKRNNENEYLHG